MQLLQFLSFSVPKLRLRARSDAPVRPNSVNFNKVVHRPTSVTYYDNIVRPQPLPPLDESLSNEEVTCDVCYHCILHIVVVVTADLVNSYRTVVLLFLIHVNSLCYLYQLTDLLPLHVIQNVSSGSSFG